MSACVWVEEGWVAVAYACGECEAKSGEAGDCVGEFHFEIEQGWD